MSNTESIPQTDSKIWACPNDCGYHIADGPTGDGEQSTAELIHDHLEYECPALPRGPFAGHAAELRRLADLLDTVTDADGLKAQDIRVSFPTTHWNQDDAAEMARVDTLGQLLNLEPAERCAHGAVTHYETQCLRDGINYWVYGYVRGEREDELERLRARVAEVESRPSPAQVAEAALTPDAVTS